MPRVKKIDFNEELSRIDAQITKCEQTLSGLKESRKQLVKQKETAELNILYDYIRQSGKSVRDFMEQNTAV